MNRLFVVAGLIILVIALVFLNQGIKKSGLPDNDDAPPPQSAAQPAPKAAAKPPVPIQPSAGPSALPDEETLGNPATAKHHIVVGWSYTDTNQQKPQALTAPIAAIQSYVQQNNGTVSAEIVNVDVPAADRSAAARGVAGNGVFVDGKPVVSGDLSATPPQQVVGAIQAAAK